MSVTILLIVLNCVLFLLVNFGVFGNDVVLGLNVLFIGERFVWQPVTSMFMHANLMHLAMNMAVLYQFGSLLEHHYGSVKFALIYAIGGVLASLLSFIYIYITFSQSEIFINLVGASGAISVLLGVLAFLDAKSRAGLLIAILLMSFAPLAMGVNVAWYAHLIGFGVGYAVAKMRII